MFAHGLHADRLVVYFSGITTMFEFKNKEAANTLCFSEEYQTETAVRKACSENVFTTTGGLSE